jgi:hypothetical protein
MSRFSYLNNIITGLKKKDGSEIVMNCSTKSKQVQKSWIKAIRTEINHHKKLVNLDKGYYANSFEDMLLNDFATKNSPNLIQLQKVISELPLVASKLVHSHLAKGKFSLAYFYVKYFSVTT